ncbi:MAG: hypothetical protein JSV88_01985 [Candidatus Aminicenantes bacterium]|nr:MAG: hypothetical protein JSV88_01985 [Candidatus Aminicenantes bacterium]
MMIEKKTSSQIVKRLMVISFCAYIPLVILIYIFTKSIFYSIIFSLGAIISISGFLLMIKMTDMVLRKGKGQPLFFLAVFSKLAVITLLAYLVSRISKNALLYYMLGLSIIVVSIGIEGIYQFYHSRNKSINRSVSNGRA